MPDPTGPLAKAVVPLFCVSFSALDPTGHPAQAVVPQNLDFRIACALNVKGLKFKDSVS